MKRELLNRTAFLLVLAAMFVFAGCNGDDNGDDNNDIVGPPADTSTTFMVTIENVSQVGEYAISGSFNTPAGQDEAAPIGPGEMYQVHFAAVPGQKLFFVTMMVESNDLFYAPMEGLALFDGNGDPLDGDRTDEIYLWDAGTEENEEPGIGPNQAPRQDEANTGPADPDTTVRLVDDEFDYPAVEDVVQVSLEALGGREFMLTIENVSEVGTLQPSEGNPKAVPLAPGVYAVSSNDSVFFTEGEPDYGHGLEALAEDGAPNTLATAIAEETWLTVPLSPGVYAVHELPEIIFTQNEPAYGNGLESLAEDGDPAELHSNLVMNVELVETGIFNTPDGAADPGPIEPEQSYSFEVTAEPGDRLSLVTMFVASNDLFYSTDDDGLPLFTVDGEPRSGDMTQYFHLWDAGTEQNEWPGVGFYQPEFQDGPDSGPADDDDTVRMVDDGYKYPGKQKVLKVTLTPQE